MKTDSSSTINGGKERGIQEGKCLLQAIIQIFPCSVTFYLYTQNVSGDFFFHMQINSDSSF